MDLPSLPTRHLNPLMDHLNLLMDPPSLHIMELKTAFQHQPKEFSQLPHLLDRRLRLGRPCLHLILL